MYLHLYQQYTLMRTIFAITLSIVCYFSYQKGNGVTTEFADKAPLSYIEHAQIEHDMQKECVTLTLQNVTLHRSVYWSLTCIALLVTIIGGIKLHQQHVNLKQKLSQKEQEIVAIKHKLHNEQETQRLIIKRHAESISSLHKKIASLTEQKDSETYNFLHTEILSAAEYDKFIHYFQISNPYLLNYLRTPDFKLTSYEIVLCILVYLNTPISHIGFLLDKKYDALKKAKQRIKNKMQIGRQNKIGAFLQEKMR